MCDSGEKGEDAAAMGAVTKSEARAADLWEICRRNIDIVAPKISQNLCQVSY